jgi:hypothetical protein
VTLRVLVCSTLLLLACSGDDSSQPDSGGPDVASDNEADDADDGGMDALPLPPVPSIQNLGGPVLTAPNVVPLIYSTHEDIADIPTFLGTLATSSYWTAVTHEYGGGPLTVSKAITITDAPPTSINDSQIQTWLKGEILGDAGVPPVTANNIYVVFYPSTTTITVPQFGWTLCQNNLGYHESIGGSPSIVYAVIPDCGPVPTRTTTGLDSVTSIASHELVEAVTDPFETSLAWATLDAPHAVWNFVPGSEVGDMCAFEPQSYARIVGPYVVQRSWSNASAAAGHDPCVPPLAQPYFNAIPLLTDSVAIHGAPNVPMTMGVQVPVGQSKTIPVQFVSDGAVTTWHVTAENEPPTSAALTFTWDVSSGNAGDVHQLTITRASADTSGRGGSEFKLTSNGAGVNNGQANYWWGFVSQ